MSVDVAWHSVVDLAEFWEGELYDTQLGDDHVLLVHLPGTEVRAFQGLCPHQEVLLADGEWDEDTGTLLCGGHRWEFDMRTGKGINPAGCTLFEFLVRIEGDTVMVGVPQDGERHYLRANESE
ncbi:MAG: Rieske 2Fe-2S domain-containing protein [Actinomycetes bacterium]